MFSSATVCVVCGRSNSGSSTLGVWIANDVDPLCSAINELRKKLEERGFGEFDIWSSSASNGGISVRVTARTYSPAGLRRKAGTLARLVRKCFGVRADISQLPTEAAVARALV